MKRPATCVDYIAHIATAAATLLLAGAFLTISAHAAAGGGDGFQPYKDAHAGFVVSKPDGWQVQTQALSIRVECPDKSEMVLTRAFTPEAGQSAGQWLEAQPKYFDALFPQGAIDHAQHVPMQAGSDEVIVDMHYQGPKGAAKARLLCRIVNGKGLLYIFAAPADRYRAEQPKMLRVAQSLVFLVPRHTGKGGGKSGTEGSGESSALTAQQAAERGMHWVTWTDPREHAFHISVPQGWTVQGGTFRADAGHIQMAYTVTSPHQDIVMMVGNPKGFEFSTLTQMNAQSGLHEGQDGILHYMHAPEFNAMYIHQVVGKGLNDLTLGEGQEWKEQSQHEADQLNQHFGPMGENCMASVGGTPFQGTDAKTGKKIAGIAISDTSCMASQQSDVATWSAQTKFLATEVGDAEEATRTKTAFTVFWHVQQTFVEDPQWFARQMQSSNDQGNADRERILGQANANIAAAGERSKQIAANSAAAEDAIMGHNNSHVAAGNTQQSAFANFIGDRTNVTNGAGQKFNVDSGYKNYYQGTNGDIFGTDSAYSPGVDFTPMTQN